LVGCLEEEEENSVEKGKNGALSSSLGIRSLNKLFLRSNYLNKLLELLLELIKRSLELEEAIRID